MSHCVMAATSLLNDEEFCDQPRCVCPTIARALIVVNDACPTDEIRERLLGHLPWLIIGTRGKICHLIRRAERFLAYAPGTSFITNFNVYDNFFALKCAAGHAAADAAMQAVHDAGHFARIEPSRPDAWEMSMKRFIDFIETEIIPVYSTMPVEPGFRLEKLICNK